VPAATLGAVSVSAPSRVSASVTLDGFDQTATFSAALSVSGGGPNGWHITAWAPKPTSGSGSLSALSVPSRPTAGTCTGKNCVDPSPTGLSWPITLGTTSGGAVSIYNAAAATGTGTDPVTVLFASGVPASTLAGSYTTTITVAIANGP
jgi:hypothetical protein